MLSIDRLNLTLPAGFEHRAEDILDHLTRTLADMSFEHSQAIEYLALEPMQVRSEHSNLDIARAIASNLQGAIPTANTQAVTSPAPIAAPPKWQESR